MLECNNELIWDRIGTRRPDVQRMEAVKSNELFRIEAPAFGAKMLGFWVVITS